MRTKMKTRLYFTLVVLSASSLWASCSPKDNLTPVEQLVDSLIGMNLHMHKAQDISVLLVDADGCIVANRKGHWSKNSGEYSMRKPDEEVRPGQLLLPVLATACMVHCGISPDTMLAIGAKRINGVDLYDFHNNVTRSRKVVDSLPLCKALQSPVAIIELCQDCFPTIDELSAAITLYLGCKIRENKNKYMEIAEGHFVVPQQSLVNFILNRRHLLLQFNDTVTPICFYSVETNSKSKETKESCLMCSAKRACLVVFDNISFPGGAKELACEILN